MTKNILQRLAVVTTGAALSLTVVNTPPAKVALVIPIFQEAAQNGFFN